jgi:hypothetical protein
LESHNEKPLPFGSLPPLCHGARMASAFWEAITAVGHGSAISLPSKNIHHLVTREMVVCNNVGRCFIDFFILYLSKPLPVGFWILVTSRSVLSPLTMSESMDITRSTTSEGP